MHLNFDGGLSADSVEKDARSKGDYETPPAFRKYAGLWLQPDYLKSVAKTATRLSKRAKTAPAGISANIAATYQYAEGREDVESPDMGTASNRFPKAGMQVRTEYTIYAHFFMLCELFKGVEKIRFYLDQESGIRAACLSAFEKEIKDKNCDAFYVSIDKEMTVDDKLRAVAESRALYEVMQTAHPDLKAWQIDVLMMRKEMARTAAIGQWADRWLTQPMPNNSEPEKALCYITDTEYYSDDLDHLANLYLKGSLHAIDRFFMQIRRRLSLLERPISTPSKQGRTWYGYSAYQPQNIQNMLEICRIYYNYCLVGKDKMTPAMRLGLSASVATPEDILYFL